MNLCEMNLSETLPSNVTVTTRHWHVTETGKLKIILSTNIAESSVTVSDAIAVVDFGAVKEMR